MVSTLAILSFMGFVCSFETEACVVSVVELPEGGDAETCLVATPAMREAMQRKLPDGLYVEAVWCGVSLDHLPIGVPIEPEHPEPEGEPS